MENRIRILATSDLQGSVYPYSYIDQSSQEIGLGRLSTLVKYLKDDNTLLLDNGNSLNGSALAHYHNTQNAAEVSPVVKAMNALGYDYVNIGNHDFNYGETILMRDLDSLKMPCITSNVSYKGSPLGTTYVVREVAGKKIAIIAVTSQYVPHWEKKENIKRFKFADALETVKKTLDMVKKLEKPDYTVCLYNGGFERNVKTGILTDDLTFENEGYQMLKELSGLDVLIAGHQNQVTCGTAFNTTYTQTGLNGQAIACIDIYTDTNVIEPSIYNTDTDADFELLELTDAEEQACQNWLNTKLGVANIDLTLSDAKSSRLHKPQLVTLLNKIQMDATGADLSASSIYADSTGIKDEITIRAVFNTVMFPNSVVVKQITGKELREYLEQCAKFWSVESEIVVISPWYFDPTVQLHNYDMVDGIEYTITVSNPFGERVTSLTYKGEEVTDDMSFKIAVSSYRAAGGGNFEMIRRAPVVGKLDSTVFTLLTNYIKDKNVINFEPVNNIIVVK